MSDEERNCVRIGRAVALALIASSGVFAQHVEARQGSIYLVGRDGSEQRLTNETMDSAPALSGSGAEVTYVRTYPASEPGSDGALSEIRVHDISSHHDEAILRGPIGIGGERYFGFGSPQFSADGSMIYFLIDWSAATHGLVNVDRRTRAVKFLLPAITFSSVLRGKYAGDMVVLQRRLKLSGGFYHLYYLFAPDGKELGVVGENQFDVGLFLNPDGSK